MFIRFLTIVFFLSFLGCNTLPSDAKAKANRLWDDDGPIEESNYRRSPKTYSPSQKEQTQTPKTSAGKQVPAQTPSSNSSNETLTQEQLKKWEQRLKEKEQELTEREKAVEEKEKELGD